MEAWIDGVGWVLLEPTAYYQLPEPEKQALTASQVQDYTQRLQQMENALGDDREFSWRGLMLGLWDMLYRCTVALLALLRLLVMQTWPLLLGLTALGLIGYLAWRANRNRILDRISYWKVNRYRPTDPRQAAAFYLGHLQAMMARRGLERPPGMTIERYTQLLRGRANLTEPGEIVDLVNTLFYSDTPASTEETQRLITAFNNLYQYRR